jgi:hypothetical protein
MSEPTTAQTVGNIFGPAVYMIAKAVESKQEFGEPAESENGPWFVKAYDAIKNGKMPFAAEGDDDLDDGEKAGISIGTILNFIALVIVAVFVYATLFDKNVLAKRGMSNYSTPARVFFAFLNLFVYGFLFSPIIGLLLVALIPGPFFLLPDGFEVFPLEAIKEVMTDKKIPEADKTSLIKYLAMLPSLRTTAQHTINMDKFKTVSPAQFGHFYY